MSIDDRDNPLAVEVQQEKAEAYFDACRKMVKSLEALKTFDCLLASLPRLDKQRRSELVEEAAERVYFVIIQREAMKLSWSDQFFEDYRVPAEVRARLGALRAKCEL